MPFISVVIPTFNRAHLVGRAIQSVLRQIFKDYDLWIIDDGSVDQTEQIVSELKSQVDCDLHYLKTENKGVSHARNVAIRASNGPWLAFLDSDDEWLPHKLQSQTSLIQQEKQLVAVHGEELWMRRGNQVMQGQRHRKSGGDIYLQSLELCLMSPSATILSRDLLTQVGLFDESFPVCEDYDLWLRICAHHRVHYISEPVIIKHGGHEDQLSHKYFAMDYWRIKAMMGVLKNHQLEEEKEQGTLRQIIRKSEILLKGYRKHNNLKNYEEILSYRNFAQGRIRP